MVVQVSPERKYAVGCLTNYKRIIFGKASITNNKFYYEIFESQNVVQEYWKFFHCNPILLVEIYGTYTVVYGEVTTKNTAIRNHRSGIY
jgi:hypothetical protein